MSQYPSGNDREFDLLKKTAENTALIADGGGGDSLPTQTGQAGKVLGTDGTNPLWQAAAGGGDALTSQPLSQFSATTSAQLRGVLSDETGTGLAYFQNGALGTPASGVATNLTGTAAGLTAGNVTTNANLTGPVTSSGNATTITNAAVTLAKMADLAQDQFIGRTTGSTGVPETATITAAARTVLDDTTVGAMVNTLGGATSTGTGGLARATSPVFVTPTLGTPVSVNLTNGTALPVGGITATGTPSNTTFLRGDGTWNAPAGVGTVTVVSSGSLASTALVTGGGSQTLQTAAVTATMDSSGNISTPGTITTGAGASTAGALELGQGTAPSAGTTSIKVYAPAAVTSYVRALPGAAATGFYLGTNSAGVVTDTQVASTGTGSVVLGTSPTVTTSLITDSATFALANTTATTVNAFGAATTLNIGANAGTVVNLGGSTSAAELRFLEPSASGTNYTSIKAKAQGSNITYTLPDTIATGGQVLTDAAGNGTLSWATPAGGGNVSNTGTPTSGQIATWTNATTLQGVDDLNIPGGDLTFTGASTITGGAGNMVVTAGTGASRTLALRTTTAGSTATTALTLGADQSAAFAAGVSSVSGFTINAAASLGLTGSTSAGQDVNVNIGNSTGNFVVKNSAAAARLTVTDAGDTTVAGDLTVSGGDVVLTGTSTITGGAGNMTITSGTGASRTMVLRTTTAGSSATTALTLGADQSATFAGAVSVTGHTTFEGVTSTGATGTGKLVYDTAPQISTIELGAASDTTLSRSAAGVLAVEGVVIPSISSTSTLTNKRVTPRVDTTASSATPAINTDTTDFFTITALAAAVTSFTSSLTGTPTTGQKLMIRIKDNGTARALAWGASFASRGATLPTTTTLSKTMYIGFIWNEVATVWDCVAAIVEA